MILQPRFRSRRQRLSQSPPGFCLTYSFLPNFAVSCCFGKRVDVLQSFRTNLRSMFYRVTRVVIVILLLSAAVRGNSQTDAKKAKHYALYAPRPQYPLGA